MTRHSASMGAGPHGPAGPSRLRHRLLTWFLVFSLVPLFVTNAVGYWRAKAILRDQVDVSMTTLAHVQAQHVRDRLDRHLLTLQAMTSGNEFLAAAALRAAGAPAGEMGEVASRDAVRELLNRKLTELHAFDAIYLYLPDGALIVAVGDTAIVDTRLRRDEGRLVAVDDAGETTAPHVHLASRVFDSRGSTVAFLGAAVRMGRSTAFFDIPPHIAGDVESFLVDSAGRPVFVSHPHGIVHYDQPLASPVLASGSAPMAEYRDRQGVSVVGAAAPVEGFPWRYLGEMSVARAYGELNYLARLSFLLESVFVVLLGVMAWLVARGVVLPVQRLAWATDRVARGDLAARVPEDRGDEIGELGRSFNEMTGALAASRAHVKELHDREIARAAQLATVGELASGIAHEIKNPVVSVSNGLDLVHRRLGNDPALSPIITEMGRQLKRIHEAIEELLMFARPATPTLMQVNANAVSQRAIRLLRPAADHAGVTVTVHPDPLSPRLMADEEMLHQALVNVLMNAVQACDAEGEVDLTVRSNGDTVAFEVRDNGRGIAPQDRENVFRPFFTTRHRGTGLGLSITRGVVERHGGDVLLSSTLGVGTTVTLRLPIEPHVGVIVEETDVEEAHA